MGINVKLPDWFQDPLYQSSQDVLFPFGKNLLSGDIPDYYKPIGEFKYGGAEFENILSLITRDTTKAVDENLVRRNMARGGVGTTAIAKSVADASRKLRFEDYSNALTRGLAGRKVLLDTGVNTLTGVRSSALDLTGQKNQFNLGSAQLAFNIESMNEQLEASEEANKNAMWQSILSSAIGAAGSIAGGIIGGPPGAMIGGKLGSAAGGGKDSISKLFAGLSVNQ